MRLAIFCLNALALAVLAGAAAAQTPIKFALDWRWEGPAAPFYVALDKGYFKAEGLDVTIDTGSGSVEGINRVASGAYQMSLRRHQFAGPVPRQAREPPVKAVMMVYDAPAFSIITLKKNGIAKPKDLEGKVLGAPAPDGAYAQWPIFVRRTRSTRPR